MYPITFKDNDNKPAYLIDREADEFENYFDNWNIVKTLGKKIEFGYPYTIGDSILLSENYIHTGDDDSLINSLVHEKI